MRNRDETLNANILKYTDVQIYRYLKMYILKYLYMISKFTNLPH